MTYSNCSESGMLTSLGFSTGGALSSRTAMLEELGLLLAAVPETAAPSAYRNAIEHDNVLHKTSASNREKTYKFLRRLYALDPGCCLFREFRRLAAMAHQDVRLIAGILAMAREPLLRECLGMVLTVPVGESLGRQQFEDWIRSYAPGRYSESMFVSFSHNLYGSFFQMGYLGESKGNSRGRTRPTVGVASVTYAAFLDWLMGMSGTSLLNGAYSRALDLSSDEHISLLTSASRQGLLKAAYSGGILELSFPGFLHPGESRLSL